jgi:hypothetical protein
MTDEDGERSEQSARGGYWAAHLGGAPAWPPAAQQGQAAGAAPQGGGWSPDQQSSEQGGTQPWAPPAPGGAVPPGYPVSPGYPVPPGSAVPPGYPVPPGSAVPPGYAVPAPGSAVPGWQPTYAASQEWRRPGADVRLRVGLFGVFVVTLGLVLLLLAVTTLDWVDDAPVPTDFSTLRAASELSPFAPGFVSAYFGWLAITLLITSVLTAYAAKLIPVASAITQVCAVLLGVAGAACTFAALADGSGVAEVFSHAGVGFWIAIVGFLLVAGGALGRRAST